jgi:hypothetical protein
MVWGEIGGEFGMNDTNIEVTVYSVVMDPALDRLVRSNDPHLGKMVEEKIRVSIHAGGRQFQYSLSRPDFTRFTHLTASNM